MKPDSEFDRRISLLPWRVKIVGENIIHEPVCTVVDAHGHYVAEYLSIGDAELIVNRVTGGYSETESQGG